MISYIFNSRLIAAVIVASNWTIGMEIGWAIEWTEVIVVHRTRVAAPCKMIDNNIYHQVHSTGMNSRGKCLQVIGASKVVIEGIKILLPVAMIRLTVGCDLGYILVSFVHALCMASNDPRSCLVTGEIHIC